MGGGHQASQRALHFLQGDVVPHPSNADDIETGGQIVLPKPKGFPDEPLDAVAGWCVAEPLSNANPQARGFPRPEGVVIDIDHQPGVRGAALLAEDAREIPLEV